MCSTAGHVLCPSSLCDELGDPKRLGTRLVVRPAFKPGDAVLRPHYDHKSSLDPARGRAKDSLISHRMRVGAAYKRGGRTFCYEAVGLADHVA